MRRIRISNIFRVPTMVGYAGDNKWLIYLGKSIIITLLSLLLSHIVLYDLENIASFVSADKSSDFQISDIYNSMADFRHVSQVSQSVTVVAVDNCTRQDLLDVLELVSEYAPKAIGLDIFYKSANDSMQVINTLQNIPNLVLPCKLELANDGQYFRQNYSFVEKYVDTDYAYINLNANDANDVIRDFTPWILTTDGDTLLHMASALAKIAAPKQYVTLRERNNPIETIQFSSVDIPIITSDEVLTAKDDDYLTRYITDRVILVGDIQHMNDMHTTPLKGMIPGVLIHAYSLNTILTSLYIDSTPQWFNWLIALLITIAFVFTSFFFKELWSHVANAAIRSMQILLMFSMVIIGAYWYNNHMQYIDFSQVVLMIGFSALASDFCDAILAIYLKSNKLINKYKKNK